MRLLHRSYNTDGQRHADRCVRPRPGEVPLRYADYAPTGFHISSDLVLRDSSCQPGCVRLDHHELLSTPQGELCFHRGGRGYEDAANVKYGHVAVDDLIDDPGPPTPSGGHRGAPASVTSERLVVRVRSIPPSMHYKRPSDTRAGSNRGARFLHYGDPAADQGDREDVHYTYLVWSFLNARGGGMVRSLLRDGDEVDLCDVPAIAMDSYDENGAVNGRVEAVYVRAEQAANELYGWLVSSHELAGDAPVPHLEPAA